MEEEPDQVLNGKTAVTLFYTLIVTADTTIKKFNVQQPI